MIAVITDDLTGAAEIGGVALEKGYKTVIKTQSVSKVEADVLVIATNMRSLDAAIAAKKSATLTEQVLALEPELIFKKVDSVLRGNVGSELEAQMRTENKSRALLIPANPSRKRTIAHGIYYIDGQPVAKSGFAQSHDFNSTTSKVVKILANRGTRNAICISPSDTIEGNGVYVGNTENKNDLRLWAGSIDGRLVPAGAADFFSAILDARPPAVNGNDIFGGTREGGRALFVCGSNFPSSRAAVLAAQSNGTCVEMPDEIYFSPDIDAALLDLWARRVSSALQNHDNVVIAATQMPNGKNLRGQKITQAMAEVTRQVVESGIVNDVMIEGGATSQAVIRALNVRNLYPTYSLAPGVTRMRVDEYPQLHVTMKPGSYLWPESIWNTNTLRG